MSKVDEKLKQSGVSEIKFYYKSLPLVGNIFTVCALISEEKKILARGVCICSVLDTHNKKIARKISRDRAIAAFYSKKNSLPIGHNSETDEEIEKRLIKGELRKSFGFKSEEQKKAIEQAALDFGFQIKEHSKEIAVFIPYFYPIDVAKSTFDWKSEYEPKPSKDELKIFRME